MDILKTVLTIIFVIDCIALACIILLQEGKSAGLGTISGAADTYWGHNKGRSMEGALVKATRVVAVLFMVLAIVLNLNILIKDNYTIFEPARARREDYAEQRELKSLSSHGAAFFS